MRIATYNVEWMTHLFDEDGTPLADERWSTRYNVTRRQQLESLGIVFTALDADAILIVEAPDQNRTRDTVVALESFARLFDLRQSKAMIGFANQTEQEIALLYDPDRLELRHDPQGQFSGKKGDPEAPRFDGTFRIDLDIDATPDQVTFSKPPLEVAARTVDGTRFRMIGVHVKSKSPHAARGDDDVMRVSIANRRKQLAQCIWLRRRVEAHLTAGDSLIVLGDFNDGPGLDEYEKLFGRSGLDIVIGEGRPREERLFDPHAQRGPVPPGSARPPATARFYNDVEKRYHSALLDFIMISPDLLSNRPAWRIWHPFDDPKIYQLPELREALLAASDHFPVTLDIDLDASANPGAGV
ncbi:endonuclease/exonuclease/phosphatase family protein [Aliiruegeria lutimaris]|uniref:Endonuclease/Exonuclease/phosphatase family protein n=1 Tax=Aliiruegeria lutimaris TaxID=571298 RepID=A0A1G9PYH1_9RHOB|nr:endonuclease/exonuclease/phosphatase family protein [Aliiruegeria lutimaris]SDM03826.1 Endonuclease/Exonuclease/phosphatase family protein [Aliiruegeria lutimaris]